MSETVEIYVFFYLWNKCLVQIPWKGHFKSGKLEFCSSRVSPKSSFFPFKTKLSDVVQDIAVDALAPDCSIQVLPICLSHCLSKVCVPAKVELFYLGFLPKCFTDSPRLWATFCRLSLRRFSGTCCLEAPFQALQQSARQAVLAHSMMYVWKCKRPWSSIA